MKPPATRQQMMQRVERALVRLSRDRYMSPAETIAACRKLVDCAQLRCGLLRVRDCLPSGAELLGLMRGAPPCSPLADKHSILLTSRLERICKSKKRKAKAELEIINYHIRNGAYRWIPRK